MFLALASHPNLDNFECNQCPVFGADYEKQLRALTKAAADPFKDAMAEASTFFSAYAAWRSSKEATTKCAEAVPPDDATDEERGWFRLLFTVLTRAPASMDKEWLLLAAVDHSLLAAAQVLLSSEVGAQGTAPVEGDAQRRTVNTQSSSNAKLQSLVSSLGAFLGRYRVAEGKALYASATCAVPYATGNAAAAERSTPLGTAKHCALARGTTTSDAIAPPPTSTPATASPTLNALVTASPTSVITPENSPPGVNGSGGRS